MRLFSFLGPQKGKTAGEEVQLDAGSESTVDGCYAAVCVKVVDTRPVYRGGWQFENITMEKLRGPIGKGQVLYPNGDEFKGTFHLSYQSIRDTAYTADGRYDFGDGSHIEHAWLNTDAHGTSFGLRGLFPVRRPDGPDSIAMFKYGKRYGIELFLDDKTPYIKEWYHGEEQHRDHPLQLIAYEIDESAGDDCLRLTMTLRDSDGDYRVVQEGGSRHKNRWGTTIYEPDTTVKVYYPNGDMVDDRYGSGLKMLRPYDFFVSRHCAATEQVRQERWKEGQMVEAKAWVYDPLAARLVVLPYPIFHASKTKAAHVWSDGHIDYGNMTYDGQTADGIPEGKGMLTLNKGKHYEGEFHEGRCHGHGVYTDARAGICQEGTWICGVME